MAVVRALPGLGDFLCVTPALRALRGAAPQAHVSLIGLSATQPLVGRFSHLVDDFLAFPGFPGIHEGPQDFTALPDFLRIVQGRHDLAVQLHGRGPNSTLFTQLLCAKITAAHVPADQPLPPGGAFLPFEGQLPEPRRWLNLLAFLGIEARGDHLEFPITPEDEAAWRALPEFPELAARPYVVLHPGASEARRRWSPEAFAQVGDDLAAQGRTVVLTGARGEADATAAVRGAMRAPALDLTGRTDLGVLAALLRGARLLVTNDTGLSHLASATKTPSVVVFIASDKARWAPLNTELHRAVGVGVPDGTDTLPTSPSVGDVLDAVQKQLQDRAAVARA